MKPTLNEKFLAYLALLSGISLSIVAEYYSILGLMAIFAAAPIPVIIMGIALGVGKITATLWLKQNWKLAPWSVKGYLLTAIAVLMLITSMGIFGFLSKAHSDQSLVSGDVLAKISVYDEKIKTAKENIDANRKALKQYDEALDAVLSRSSSEAGADKAVSIRRSQQKERARLQSEIQTEQATISRLGEERAPIAAEVRKVEAEVGPIKYIAAFVYGETDETILEKAVTWVIIILIVVFDPLAVILLLSSQISFQNFRERELMIETEEPVDEETLAEDNPTVTSLDDEVPAEFEWAEQGAIVPEVKDIIPETDIVKPVVELSILKQHPYLNQPFATFKNLQPIVYKAEGNSPEKESIDIVESTATVTIIPEVERSGDYLDEPLFVQNEEQKSSGLWTSTLISKEEYLEVAANAIPDDLYNDAPDPNVAEFITLIKAGKMTLQEVPEEYLLAVKARM